MIDQIDRDNINREAANDELFACLKVASVHGDSKIITLNAVRILCNKGADPGAKQNGLTVIETARKYGRDGFLKAVIDLFGSAKLREIAHNNNAVINSLVDSYYSRERQQEGGI